jgi:hypothetical protein
MQSYIFIKTKKIFRKIWEWNYFTADDLVNWFVDWVNWTIDDACNVILFDVLMTRFVMNVIR